VYYFNNSVIERNEAILSLKLLHSFFVLNDIKKSAIIFLFVLISFVALAQTSNKKRVLVVPYGRFEFVSEYSLEEIAEKNKTTANNVFLIYQKAILNAFEKHEDENFEFVAVDMKTIIPYQKFIKYKYDKFNGKQYYASDLKTFPTADFTAFLESQQADFVLFLTWYDIKKQSFTRNRKHEKRKSYAGHYIDFDIYNLFKEKIVGKGKVKAEASIPNDLEVSYKLLRTKELESAYDNFISKIVEQLNKPIEN